MESLPPVIASVPCGDACGGVPNKRYRSKNTWLTITLPSHLIPNNRLRCQLLFHRQTPSCNAQIKCHDQPPTLVEHNSTPESQPMRNNLFSLLVIWLYIGTYAEYFSRRVEWSATPFPQDSLHFLCSLWSLYFYLLRRLVQPSNHLKIWVTRCTDHSPDCESGVDRHCICFYPAFPIFHVFSQFWCPFLTVFAFDLATFGISFNMTRFRCSKYKSRRNLIRYEKINCKQAKITRTH